MQEAHGALATDGWFLFAFLVWGFGALVGWVGGPRRLPLAFSHLLAAAGSVAIGVVGWLGMQHGVESLINLMSGPFGAYQVRVDRLSGLFLLILGLVGTAAAIYGIGYTKAWVSRRRARTLAALFNVFLLAMAAVLTAADAYTFLLAWEAMSVSSFFLVVTEYEQKPVRKAGLLYLVMTHLATAFIVLACLIWYVHQPEASRSLSFDALGAVGMQVAPWLRSTLFLLFLVGFGTKAGAVPLHIWLPKAHPVAPSHISALMSAVMVKVGLYGILRFAVDLLGPGPVWWGGLLLAVGILSAVGGAIYANQESDLKRLLAFSTVENIGIMLVGLGVAEVAQSAGQWPVAALALLAMTYHMLGHSAYKGLLFLGAGSVLHGTGQRSLERLGGLIRKMPTTALFFFIGSMAISGLPPLAGFASEWLTMGSLARLTGPGFASWLQVLAPLLIAAIGMVAALVAATMVKAFGVGFLGMPRSEAAQHPHEADSTMLGGMGLLTLAVVGLGILPRHVLNLLWPAVSALLPQAAGATLSLKDVQVIPLDGSFFGVQTAMGNFAPGVLVVALLGGLGIGYLLTRLMGRRTPVRRSPVWASGIEFAPVNQYTAGSFAKPLRLMLRTVLRPQREVKVLEGGGLFPRRLRYRGQIRLWLEPETYRYAVRLIVRFSRWVRGVQMGSLHRYLAYMFVALLLLLLFAR